MINILDKLKQIKIVIFDFEGVLSFHNQTACIKRLSLFNAFLKSCNIKTALISGSDQNPYFEYLKTIGFSYIKHSSYNKINVTNEILEIEKIDYSEVLYIGDDILDLPVINKAGLSLAPESAHKMVLRQSSSVLKGDNPNEIIINLYKLFEMALVLNN